MADPPQADPVIGVPGYAGGGGQNRGWPHPSPHPPPEPPPPRKLEDVVSVLGIPEEGLTPEVRAALLSLMDEVGLLHWEASRAIRLQEFLKQQTHQDSVLPLMNRRTFMRELAARIERASMMGVAGALAYFHLDSYESLRRTHGLAVAEGALRHVATTLLNNVRDSDLVGTIGGGGIGVILTVTEEPGARAKVDALLDVLRKLPFHWGERNLALAIACGLREFAPGDTAEDALAAADAALRLAPLRLNSFQPFRR